jgi:hypothetical protein
MTQDQSIERLKELSAKATSGPWAVGPKHVIRHQFRDKQNRRVTEWVAECVGQHPPGEIEDNAAFIAAAVNYIRANIDSLTPSKGVDQIRSQALEEAARGWRPIKTAPKDQKVLVGYWNPHGKWRTVKACYYTQLRWSDEHHWSEGDGEYAPPGWYEESETHDTILPLDCAPTHWMPLPVPPSSEPLDPPHRQQATGEDEPSVTRGRYRKRPVVIDAFRWTDGAECPDWLGEAFGAGIAEVREPAIEAKGVVPHIVIRTLEGTMQANVGDWIIRDVKGEIYPCKPDIFAATYEPSSQPTEGSTAPDVEKARELLAAELKKSGWPPEAVAEVRNFLKSCTSESPTHG